MSDQKFSGSAELSLETVCRALFESAAEGLVVADSSGRIRMANGRLEELFGYTNEELIGERIGILVPQEFAGGHKRHIDGYFKAPSRKSMGIGRDLRGVRKDGVEFPVEIALNHFKVGENTMVMALVTDITLRVQAKQELEKLNQELEERVAARTRQLRESQKLYNIIARNFPNGTINVFDQKLNYVFVEGKELFRMGVTGDHLVGKNYLERLDPSLRETIQEKLERVFAGENLNFGIAHNGLYYQLNAVGLQDALGEITQIMVVEQNVTSQKRAEGEVRKALNKERELNELKSRFVSMASHEFRTPLSTILTSLSLLERYTGPEHEEKRKKHFHRIRSGVHNLTGILNDFLSLDKLEEGRVESHPTQFVLKEMIHELVESMQAVAKRGQKIVLNYAGEGAVRLDRKLLHNILVNLISNAIKYSNENSEIKVDLEVADEHLNIAVIDHGIGIPEEDQAHMFERFFRAKNATNLQGTGLGLNIVKKYLDLMDGSIQFESELERGSTFRISVPLK